MKTWCGLNGVYKDVKRCALNHAICECGNPVLPKAQPMTAAVPGDGKLPRIYLVSPDFPDDEDAGPGAPEYEGVYWCEDRVHASDVEYIRADLAAQSAPGQELSDQDILAHVSKQPVRLHHGAAVFEYRLFDLIDFARAVLAAHRNQKGGGE